MDFKLKKSNLNFRVYTAASIPATGTENDICIVSEIPMTNWILSPDTPSGAPRTDGDVWIQYSVSGTTFNALKNNAMMIATISAWQHVDGAWVDREAVSCHGGEWVQWITVLWNASESYENTNVLGSNGFYITKNSHSSKTGSLSKSSDGMSLNSNASDNVVFVSHDNIIDFTGLTHVTVTWDGGSTYENYQGIGVYSNNKPSAVGAAIDNAYLHKDNTNLETVTLNVEHVNQKGYIVITAYNANLNIIDIICQ